MANVQTVKGKKGVSYKFTAYCGYDAKGVQIRKTKTWRPEKKMTEEKALEQAKFEAKKWEEDINQGQAAFDGRVKFEVYATTWLGNAAIAPKTRERYVVLLRRINQSIGHMKLEAIQAHHLESFYTNLKENNVKETGRYAVPCVRAG